MVMIVARKELVRVNENKSDKKIIMYVGLLVACLTILSLIGTYAWYSFATSKNEEVGVEAASNLKLVYTDCNTSDVSTCADINKDLSPGDSVEKVFEVTNTSGVELSFTLYFQELLNTFKSDDLVYKLENMTSNEVIIPEKPVPYAENKLYNQIIGTDIKVPGNATNRYKLTITFLNRDRNQNENLEAKYFVKISIKEGEVKKTLVQALLEKTNDVTITDYNAGVKGEMFTFKHNDLTTTSTDGTNTYTHEATQVMDWTEEERTDYRYIGDSPNNYINFNDETWRIIGVFTVEGENGEKEQSVKIIRDESLGKFSWDHKADKTFISEWPTSSLATMLNGDYLNSGGSFTYTWYDYDETAIDSTVQGLNFTAKSQIFSVKWYLGGSTTYQNLGGPDYYNFERGTTTCVITGNCSGQTRSTNWVANVGLMYPSDYIYTYSNGVDNTCYTDGYHCDVGVKTNGWLYNSLSTSNEWLISPYAPSSSIAFLRISTGFVSYNGNLVSGGHASRPCVYLRSDIQVTGGDGSSVENAYTISVPTN